MSRPHYFQDDVHSLLLQGEPMMHMHFRNDAILRLLTKMCDVGLSHREYLRNFSNVRCEPLDFFYQCKRGMDAFDIHLFTDMLTCYGWREAHWGAWLAALAPNSKWIALLRDKRAQLPHAVMAFDLALSAAEESSPEHLAHHLAVLTEVRKMLLELPAMPHKMRLHPTAEQQAMLDAETERLRTAFRDGGFPSARPLLCQGMLGYYTKSRHDWLDEERLSATE